MFYATVDDDGDKLDKLGENQIKIVVNLNVNVLFSLKKNHFDANPVYIRNKTDKKL